MESEQNCSLVDLECEVPTSLHTSPLLFASCSGTLAPKVIPPLGNQNATRVMRTFRGALLAIRAIGYVKWWGAPPGLSLIDQTCLS